MGRKNARGEPVIVEGPPGDPVSDLPDGIGNQAMHRDLGPDQFRGAIGKIGFGLEFSLIALDRFLLDHDVFQHMQLQLGESQLVVFPLSTDRQIILKDVRVV